MPLIDICWLLKETASHAIFDTSPFLSKAGTTTAGVERVEGRIAVPSENNG
ncbi:MAG: hypothetical protein AB7H80_02305 [Candidatus Kapaibacterium sp.]